MKKMMFAVVLIWLLGANVFAADTGYSPSSNNAGVGAGDIASSNPIGFIIGIAALDWAVIPGVLLGTVASIGAILVLQYIGIDVIGWSLEIGKFFFEYIFLLIRWTLATEANLISMAVLFLVFWIWILFGLPKML